MNWVARQGVAAHSLRGKNLFVLAKSRVVQLNARVHKPKPIAMNWYYLDNGTQRGPITDADFGPLTQQGVINAGTFLWCEGMADWKTYGELTGISAAQPTAVATAAAEPAAGLRVQREAAPAFEYAPPPLRIAAYFIDVIIVAAVFVIGLWGTRWILMRIVSDSQLRGTLGVIFFGLIILWVIDYFSGNVARKGGTTGQTMLGMKVVTANGAPPSFLRALGRFFMFLIINQFTLSLGQIVAFFDSQKRCLHDIVCGTVVLKK